jgi:phthalate 4,5-cis-dihydrodiol dehydrogenase
MQSEPRRLRVGVVGLGRAFSFMAPTFALDARVEVVAGCDPRAEARQRFAADFGAATYSDVNELCRDDRVEVVYIATPHQYHAPNAIAAARAGRHVLVEKPMALTLEDCAAMIEAAHAAGVYLFVGHSHSFDAPVQRAAALAQSGAFGALKMITALNYTDFLYRPRRPEELDTGRGGGVIFNQAPHQVEMLRLIGGGKLASVRASAGVWDASRPTQGAYSAFFMFEAGASATLTYGGYAHFDTDEFCDWIGESGAPKNQGDYGAARRRLRQAAEPGAEAALKAAANYGGARYAGPGMAQAAFKRPPHHQNFGFLLASCERADLRPTSKGVLVYGDDSVDFEEIPVPPVPRQEVIDELWAAVVDGVAPIHDGAWSLATMEACLAILQSSRENREIELARQVALRPSATRAKAVL